VGHGEDAIPAGRRLIEEIILAALPIGAGWAVVAPLVENGLERFLRRDGDDEAEEKRDAMAPPSLEQLVEGEEAPPLAEAF
jgi:hypothetical protein